ncbi:MAG: hypothetical protein HY360_04575 [Verrucomicrobia bacterium]|nr:hypothetical protein [Verrucomicrobiota bacterium]
MRNHLEEIELALSGGAPRYVPLSFYDVLFPPGFDPAPLQSKGMAICARRSVWRKITPRVKVREIRESDGGIRTFHETPIGTLTSLHRTAALGLAPVEHPIKKRDDYRIARFIVEDTEYQPDYETFLAERKKIGVSGKTMAHTCYEPLMDIQVVWVGQEQFCYELVDNEDALLDFHEALVKNHRKMYAAVAQSPADYVLYGGNIVPDMLGPERVRDLIAPCWNAFADRLHERGKQIGCHLDSNNRLILDVVNNSRLDFVEAFTPPPDCNVSVAEARQAWPNKKLWINFPSSVHLQSDDEIRRATVEIIRQAGDRKGFLMGITEDVPREHIARSISAILEAIRSCPKPAGCSLI